MRFSSLLALGAGLAAAALTAVPALAGPFAEVGDRQLRQDVDLLYAAGLIEGPVDSYPLPWAQIEQGLDKAKDGRVLDPHLKAAADRLDRLADFAAERVSLDIRIAATNEVSVARDFGNTARAQFDGSGRIEYNDDRVSVALGAGLRSGVRPGVQATDGSTYVHFEPSQVAVRLGNWALYGGYTEQWWGPGQDGALLWSNSTRPMPKIGIKRLVPDRIDFPVLRWLGPVRLDFFVGVLDEARDFRNSIVVGTRINFAPARGLQIGLNRSQQLCGQGRPCGAEQIAASFLGVGNLDNPRLGSIEAFRNQAGNQIAGYDISYVQRFGKLTAKVYFEGEAEDFDNVIIEQYGRLIGGTLAGPIGGKGASFTTTAEYADTFAAALFNGTPLEKLTGSRRVFPISLYNNSLYTSGYAYRALPIGHWADGDARVLTVSAAVTDTRNRRYYASARSVELNITDLGNPPRTINLPGGFVSPPISYRTSASREKFAMVTAGAELPMRFGDVRIEGRYQTDSPDTPGRREGRGAIEVQFRQRF